MTDGSGAAPGDGERRAVLFDAWHTLFYLTPEGEERYLRDLRTVAAGVFDGWRRSPRARHPVSRDSEAVAVLVLADASEAAARGVSVPLSVQAGRAARRLGRIARPLDLERAVGALVDRTTFERAPGAPETLERLQAAGFRLGVVSNTVGEPGEAVQRAFDRLGLARFFDAWAFSDQLPWAKPAPEIFWHCLGMLGVDRSRAVHVGDGPPDMAGAHAAGLRGGILFTGVRQYAPSYARLFHPDRPELALAAARVDRLEDVPAVADRLLGRPAPP